MKKYFITYYFDINAIYRKIINISIKQILLGLVLIINFESDLLAFDMCNNIEINHHKLKKQITNTVHLRTPVKYLNLLQEIKLITADNRILIPYAAESEGLKILVFPSKFAKVMCQISLATLMKLEGISNNVYNQAANDAGKCFSEKKSETICLTDFGNQLAKEYHQAFSILSERRQRVAYILYESALNQVIMHEYSHHFLNHFKQKGISRINAEFEADLFAIMNGLQTNEPSSAMYYFFNGLAEIEKHTLVLNTTNYQSAECRARNINEVVHFIGAAPLLLLDAVWGGNYLFEQNSKRLMQSIVNKNFAGTIPTFTLKNCKKLDEKILVKAYLELQELYIKITKNSNLLFSKNKKMDVNSLNILFNDLVDMANRFYYMNGLAGHAASLLIRRIGLENSSLLPFIDYTIEITKQNILNNSLQSRDMGRLIQAHGLAVIQEQTSLPLKNRLDKAFLILQEAVFYNPNQSESWMNLAFISFKRGQCENAVKFSEQSLNTFNGEEQKSLKFFY
jgi:hypothetical protein